MMTWSIDWDKTTEGGTMVNEFEDFYYGHFMEG